MPRGQRFKNYEEKMNAIKTIFWSKVEKTETCWLWTGAVNGDGYGLTYDGYRSIVAHRWSYMHLRGEIPDGLCVLHHCDNPPCVNPAHLFLGTRTDNHKDMMAKGRNITFKGENNGQSKVTEKQVDEIIELYRQGSPVSQLCGKFSISRQGIWRIVSGKHYANGRDDGTMPPLRIRKRFITYEGETLTLGVWADRIGITSSGLHRRLNKMSFDKAMKMKIS